MHDLVALIDQYRPGFADAVVPAEERRIESLERLAGALPGALRRFLQTMGGSPPRLLVDSLYLGVDPMRRALLMVDSLKDERYLIVSKYDEHDALIWMDRAAPTPPDDAMLVPSPAVYTPNKLPRTPFAVGLEDHLYVEGFRCHRLSLCLHHAFVECRRDLDTVAVQRALALPLALGFDRLAPSQTSGLFERGDAAIIVRRAPFDASIHVHIAADDPEALQPLVEAFAGQPGWERT